LHAEDFGWPLKKAGKNTNAETNTAKVIAFDFAPEAELALVA
jgi:hypothetical protein